ncbi:unnamed protein product [Closterium sp. NIES-54]
MKDVDKSSGKAEATGRRRARWSAWWIQNCRLRRKSGSTSRRSRPLCKQIQWWCCSTMAACTTSWGRRSVALSDDVKHVHGFNGALQVVEGRSTVALEGEAGKQVLILDMVYVPGVQENLLSASQLKESGVKLQDDGDGQLLVLIAAEPSTGADLPCVSCVEGKLARHTFPDKGSDAEKALAVVHIDLCGPFRVAAKDDNLYFLLLKDRHTRFVWVVPVAKKSDVLREFEKSRVLVERQMKKSMLMLHSDRGGDFLGKEFTNFVNGKGIVHDLTCPYTPQQNGMAKREMRMVIEFVRTMLLHIGVQHHWWHLALRQALQRLEPELRRLGRTGRPPKWLSYHACLPPAVFTTVYDDAKDDVDLPELDPDIYADPEHPWDSATMAVKEALASLKGENRWVLTTKYRIDDTVEHEKARLVVKGFTHVYGADYDETYSPVSSYIMPRIFLSIVTVLDLDLMRLDMKSAFLQSNLDRIDLVYVNTALYFKKSMVYVDKLLAVRCSTAMLKELLEAAFELREISPIVKYLGLEIVRNRPGRKLWLHQQGYGDKLCKHFIDEEQGGRISKTPVSVNAYAEMTFDDKEAQERKEEYQQKVGSLQFAAKATSPNIAFSCSKLGSGLMVRSDQHWREVDCCLAYLADTRDTALEFGGGPESLNLVGYVDPDDAGNKQNRTSTGGYVYVYGGVAVSWSSSRIKCATLSSNESEYVAATDAGKEGRQLRFLLAKFQ